jgi:uncharacterized protein YceK
MMNMLFLILFVVYVKTGGCSMVNTSPKSLPSPSKIEYLSYIIGQLSRS